MDNDTKIRYQILKNKNKEMRLRLSWESNLLLQESLQALKEYNILPVSEMQGIIKNTEKNFSFNQYGRIDWAKVKKSAEIDRDRFLEIIDREKMYYIIWDEIQLPIVESAGENIIFAIEDLLAVSFDTWLVSFDFKEIIEFYHEGKIIRGTCDF